MTHKIFRFIETKQKQIVMLFFTLFLVGSAMVLKDYGLNWDEEMQWKLNGEVNATYIIYPDEDTKELLLKSKEKYHGPAFEIILVFFENIFDLNDTRDVYLMRHCITFFTFFIGVVFFYLLCKRCFGNWKLALTGCLFLVLSPRIFGDSFHNSKDIPFLSFFIMSMYTLLRFHEQPNYKNAIAYAAISGFTIDIRIMGVILPVISAGFFCMDLLYVQLYKKKKPPLYFNSFILYLTCLIAVVILCWPILWHGPVYHFSRAFKEMSQFPWDNEVLYQGKYIKAPALPWHYFFVWIGISTPLPYLILFFTGLFFILQQIWLSPLNFIFHKKSMQLLLICSILVPATVVILKSVLYDGWRHLFFIYPAIIMIGLYGLIYLYRLLKRKKIYLFMGVTLVAVFNLVVLFRLHPQEYVYFNMLAGKDMAEVKNKFELDYYGISSKQALEYILEHDTSSQINIYADQFPQRLNVQFLPIEQRNRIRLVEFENATYFVGQHRFQLKEYTFDKTFFSILVGNASIMDVFELTEHDKMKHNFE